MFKILKYTIFSIVFLVIVIVLSNSNFILPNFDKTVEDIAITKNDKKIARTLKAYSIKTEDPVKSSRKKIVDRPGMVLKFRMPYEIMYRFQMARKYKKPPILNQTVATKVSIEGGPYINAFVKVRGNSSIDTDKKSFNVNLFYPQRFTKDIKLSKFFLINLLVDEFGVKNKFSYDILETLDLFFSYTQYVIVYINDEIQGLYLLVERPKDAIKRIYGEENLKSLFRAHKQYNEFFLKYSKTDYNAWDAINKLLFVHTIVDKKEQMQKYDEILNMNMYFKWVAFNSLVQNSDSKEEFFLYEVENKDIKKGQFQIMHWDYDDLHKKIKHPERIHKDDLMWATERQVDKQIINNPFLYSRYKVILSDLITNVCSEQFLEDKILEIKNTLDGIDFNMSLEEEQKLKQERDLFIKDFKQKILQRRNFLLECLKEN